MLLSVLPDFDQRTPHATPARKPTRIVWQERYEGIAVVAYQGGKAVAGISGPWSGKYALTWWDPMPGGQLEIFDTLTEARESVERRMHAYASGRAAEVFAVTDGSPAPDRHDSWFSLLLRALVPNRRRTSGSRPGRAQEMRQRYLNQETDLSGLNFSASR